MSKQLYVRLKPYNPRRGFVLRRYSFRGLRFLEGHWYRVPIDLAKQLGEVHQRHNDEDSPLAFDVATQAQAEAIEDAERKREEAERRKLSNAEVVGARSIREQDIRGDLTTRDLAREVEAEDAEEQPAAPDDRELGMDMSNTRDELLDAADMLGVKVPANATKAQILKLIKDSVAE